MQKSSPYTAGWIDTTIHDFLSEIADPPHSMAYALITCLDSSGDVASIFEKSAALQPFRNAVRFVGKSVLLPTRRLLAIDGETRFFFGFDEIWFSAQSKIRARPEGFSIVGPARIASELIDRMSSWITKNSITLGLGDGAGMNFCAKLRGVAKHLVMSSRPAAELEDQGRAIA